MRPFFCGNSTEQSRRCHRETLNTPIQDFVFSCAAKHGRSELIRASLERGCLVKEVHLSPSFLNEIHLLLPIKNQRV